MLLAAGLGTRLRPLTDEIPKCMVPVAGRPILEHVVRRLHRQGVDDLVINLHYRPDVVTRHFGDGSELGVHITWSHEPELLGTAGSVRKAANHFTGSFFVWYADNISDCDLGALWRRHQDAGAWVTMALHEREDPTSSGIVELDEDGMVQRFLEKPSVDEVFSHLVNAGILVIDPRVPGMIPAHGPSDFSAEVLPDLLSGGRPLAGYRLSASEGLWWADRPEDLEAMDLALRREVS